MLKEFILYPATVEVDNQGLTITSKLKSLSLSSAWLRSWQQRVEHEWPKITALQQDKELMQVMLEGEGALVLLPLLLAQQSGFSKHILYSDHVVFLVNDWEQIERFYQESGVEDSSFKASFSYLRQHWPLALPGVHRIDFADGRGSLTLGFGEPNYLQQQWLCSIDLFVRDEQQSHTGHGQERLWPWVLRYAAAQSYFLMPNALLQREDFLVAAKKAGMVLEGSQATRPHLQKPQKNTAKTMAIIGGGIAGAGIAAVMYQRNWQVTVFDPMFSEGSNACKHKNHLAAAMTPFISVDDNHKSRLSRTAMLRALYHWRDFPDEVMVSRGGNLEVNRDKGYGKDITQAVESLNFPKEWVQRLNPAEVSERLGFELEAEGIFWPMARLISPEKLLEHIYTHYPVQQRSQSVAYIRKQKDSEHWQLFDAEDNFLGEFEQVVIANAADCMSILERSALLQRQNVAGESKAAMPKIEATMHWMGGEVMHVAATKLQQVPQVALGGQGYFLPPTADNVCVLGSTYRHGERDPGVSLEGQRVIKDKIPLALDELTLSSPLTEHLEEGWSGGRAVVQGRLPVICELDYAQGIWLAVAYGSHGLTWSSFAGDIIGAALDGEPIPLEKELLKALGLR